MLAEDPEFHLDMEFAPGDIQFLHNHTVFHDRTAFVDWPEPDRKRYLLRLWLCPRTGGPCHSATRHSGEGSQSETGAGSSVGERSCTLR